MNEKEVREKMADNKGQASIDKLKAKVAEQTKSKTGANKEEETKEPVTTPVGEVKEPVTPPVEEAKEPETAPAEEVKEPVTTPVEEPKTPEEKSSIDKLKDAAKANSGAQGEAGQEAKTTSEFDKSEKQEDTDDRVTADTDGVLNYVEYPLSVDNEMPAEKGQCANSPIATWEKKRAIGNKNIVYGRFLANVDGKQVEEVHTQRTEVRADIAVPQQLELKEAKQKILEGVKALAEPNMDALREYMSVHCRYCYCTTDRDNKTTIKITCRKDKDGITATGFKAGETGCGTIKQHIINVPQRAYQALNTASYSDTNLTREIIAETEPSIIQVIIKHSDFTSFLGSKTENGILVLETLSDKASANKVISDNPAIGVREMIKAVYKGKPYKVKTTSDMTAEQIAKRDEAKEKYEKKKSEVTNNQGELTAIFTLEYKAKSNVRTRLISPINYVPMKTQKTIPAGAFFREKEGASAADLTKIYLTEPIKKTAAANASFDSVVGSIKEPTEKDKFYFVPEVKPDGVGVNPIFYNTGKKVEVEPYFSTFTKDKDAYKAKKIPKELREVIKKVPTAKGTSYQTESCSIFADTGYDMSYYESVISKVKRGSSPTTHVLTIEELKTSLAKTKAKSSSSSSSSRATANLDDFLTPYERAMMTLRDSEAINEFQNVTEAIKATKKDDNSKITEWSHISAKNRKAVISRSALKA